MKKVLLVVVLAAVALWAAPAQAAFMTGGIAFSAVASGGVVPIVPIDATGATTTLGAAKALDFTKTGTATPGQTGFFAITQAVGSFTPLATLPATIGEIKDFSFVSGLGLANYPYPPITGFEIVGSPSFSFDIDTVTVLGQTANQLELGGQGLFHFGAYDPTPGVFYFSINNTNTVLSFSAAEGVVPEPGSMMLLGTGLFGLAGAVRRRLKK